MGKSILLNFDSSVLVSSGKLSDEEEGAYKIVPISILSSGTYQPRRAFNNALVELSESIKHQGILEPIVVRSNGNDKYEIIAGERRWRAAELAGLSEVPILIKQVDNNAALIIALIENLQREDLNVMEEAEAFERLRHEFNLTHEQISEQVGKSRSDVTNKIRLLLLQKDVRALVSSDELSFGHARALLPLSPDVQLEAAQNIIQKQLSVRDTEQLVQKLKNPSLASNKENPNFDLIAWTEATAERFSARLKAKVKVHMNNAGKGRVVIKFDSPAEVDWMFAQLQDKVN